MDKIVKRRHHYLPIKYQEGFGMYEGNRCLVWWFNRERNIYRREQPKNIAVEKDFYTVAESGELDDSLENALASVEGATWPVFEKLSKGAQITREDRITVSMFASLMQCRTPEFLETIRQLSQVAAKAVVEKGWAENAPPELLQDSRPAVINAIKSAPFDTAPLIESFDWAVLHAPREASFILTDAPFIVVPPDKFSAFRGVGLRTPNASKFLPLSSTTCLFMGRPGNRLVHKKVGPGRVRQINHSLAVRAFRNVIARDEPLLRKVVERAKIDVTPPGPLVVVH